MSKVNAVHHVAISTADMKSQLEFFSDVLGLELVGLFWMHGVPDAWHAFMKLGDASFSFVFLPGNAQQKTTIGHTHAGNGAGTSAPGTMQHIALNVDTMDDLLFMRDRIRSRGVPVFGPLDHGLCHSVYFAGPENLALELATTDQAKHPLDSEQSWIDPEVASLAGLSPEDIQKLCRPEPFEQPAEPIAQPAYSENVPHLSYPEDVYQAMLSIPDEHMNTRPSDRVPPALTTKSDA